MTRPRIDWRDVLRVLIALLGFCMIGYGLGMENGLRDVFMGSR